MNHRALPLLLLALVAAAPAADPVTVDRKAATAHTRGFDPKHPPAELHLTGTEAAVTNSSFLCGAAITATILTQKEDGPRSTATIRVDGLKLELSLDQTIYLPASAPKKLTAHEEGHRQIAEVCYQSAELFARRLATPLIGKTFTATGTSAGAASHAAIDRVVKKLCDDYMATAPSQSSTVNDTYDKLTDHGRNDLAEADAIRQSFDQYLANHRPKAKE